MILMIIVVIYDNNSNDTNSHIQSDNVYNKHPLLLLGSGNWRSAEGSVCENALIKHKSLHGYNIMCMFLKQSQNSEDDEKIYCIKKVNLK